MQTCTSDIRINNKKLILEYIRSHPESNKQNVVKEVGLSQGTVNTLLNQLAKEGKVIKNKASLPTNGRPFEVYSLQNDFAHVCCLYMEETKKNSARLVCAVYNLNHSIIFRFEEHITDITPEKLREFIQKILLKDSLIQAIGIGIPAIINRNGDVEHCDFESFENFGLLSFLQKDLSVSMYVNNDVTSIASGIIIDKQEPNHCESAAVLFLPKNSPPGAGLIVDGKAIQGFSNFAGEVRFLPPALPKKELTDERKIVQHVACIISSIICIINPARILLTGNLIQSTMVSAIKKECEVYVPPQHLPIINYQDDIQAFYLHGIWKMLETNYIQELGGH